MSYIIVNGLYVNNNVVTATHIPTQEYQITVVDVKEESVAEEQTVEKCEQKHEETVARETTKTVECEQIKTEIIVKEEEIENECETEIVGKEGEIDDNESEIAQSQQVPPISKYRKYACELCPKRFKQRYALLDHREEEHDKKPVDCAICGKTFASNCTLKRHNKRFHSQSLFEAFPYACDICHQRFNSIKKHVDHKLLHTDPDAFKCNECGKRFANSFALTRHGTRHTSVRQVCKTCKRSYKTVEDLQKHVGIHTGKFWCDVCAKVFPSKGNLTMHKKVHLKEHVYCCQFCGQCFRCNFVRMGHEKTCGKGEKGVEIGLS